jgi:hypothetical protein
MPDWSRFVEIDVSEPRAYFLSLWERSEVRVRSIATGSKSNIKPISYLFWIKFLTCHASIDPVATAPVLTHFSDF